MTVDAYLAEFEQERQQLLTAEFEQGFHARKMCKPYRIDRSEAWRDGWTKANSETEFVPEVWVQTSGWPFISGKYVPET